MPDAAFPFSCAKHSSNIMALNFCHFAKRERDRNGVRFRVIREDSLEQYLLALIDECLTKIDTECFQPCPLTTS